LSSLDLKRDLQKLRNEELKRLMGEAEWSPQEGTLLRILRDEKSLLETMETIKTQEASEE